jgi:hypothetical protein
MSIIKFKRGYLEDMPQNADLGEPLFCLTDLNLYIGMGAKGAPRQIGIIDPEDFQLTLDYYERLYKFKFDPYYFGRI